MPQIRIAFATFGALLAAAAAGAAAEPLASVDCEARDNGRPASAKLVLWSAGETVAQGRCGSPLKVPPGRYRMGVQLDTALDAPTWHGLLQLEADSETLRRAEFETGVLEVRIVRGGRPVAGRARVERRGRPVGEIAAGVARRLSAGSYAVTAVDNSGAEIPFGAVHVAPRERRVLVAEP